MALSIINNTTAIGAMNSVNSANSQLSNTIKQLSTGMRINSASDDASGLAVSEKLRAQISGLSKAAANAQDGISMLQTAEGAMGSMTSIIQRMRELAVQAGDPAYTTNDRAMLQLEVDQLKEEINRISTSTEFNTKKLLNGDAAALWSATSNEISAAVVKGSPAEGNYRITYSIEPGKNAVYKTDVMSLGDGVMSYDMIDNDTSVKRVSGIKNMKTTPGDYVNIQTLSAANSQGVRISTIGSSGSKVTSSSITAMQNGTVTSVATAATVGADNSALYTFINTGNSTITINLYTAAGSASAVYTIELAAGQAYQQKLTAEYTIKANVSTIKYSKDTAAGSISGARTSFTVEIRATSDIGATGGGTAQMRIRNSKTGEISDWIDATVSYDSANTTHIVKATNQGSLYGAAGTEGYAFSDIKYKTGSDVGLERGDTILIGAANKISSNNTADYMIIQVQDSAGTNNNPAVYYERTDIYNQGYDKTTTLYTAQIDNAGNVYYGSLDVTMAAADPKQVLKATATTTTNNGAHIRILGEGDVASSYTRLSDVARFVNDDGVNILANTRDLSIYNGKGDSVTIYLEGSDTIGDFEEKLTQALIDLGMGASPDNSHATTVNNNLVNFVKTGKTNSNEAVEGTFVIQGALLGDMSNLSFSGDQGLIDALSIAQIQEAEDSITTIRVNDAHSGAFVGEETVTDGRLRGVIDGIDVIINPVSAANVNYDTDNKKMEFTSKSAPVQAYLHVVDNATRASIGANEGQVLDISIAQLDTTALEIDDVNVVSFDNAQKSITKLDQALKKISRNRATAGAQMNRLEYAINNLNTTRENLTASESRIRDLDIAQATSNLAAQQVLLQSATAMLAQANTLPQYAAQLLR